MLNIQVENTCSIYLRGSGGPDILNFRDLLGVLLALFLALGCFLGVFFASGCVFGQTWSVFVRLGNLRARFFRGRGRSDEGLGGSRALFSKAVLQQRDCNKTIVFTVPPAYERDLFVLGVAPQ